jgi:integrase
LIKKLKISKEAKADILSFQRDCLANGIGPARILRYLDDLPKIAERLEKDFKKARSDDIKDILIKFDKLDISDSSKLEIRKTLKKFYKWLNGGQEYPESVKWLKTGLVKNGHKLPEELITQDEVKKIIEAARSPRDRALISLMWETGCRAGEILTLQIKHISFEDNLTRVLVDGKTGPRRIPVIDSTPYLAEWIENHPFKSDPNSYLWVGIGTVGRNNMLSYAAFRKMISELGKKIGIKKRLNPHNFRHSRSTYLAKHLTEAQMEQYLGWVTGSNMPATYVHLSGRDMDDCILKLNGEKPKHENRVESILSPKTCPRCTMLNKATGKFCTRCGAVLDIDTAIKMQDEMKKIDDQFATLLQDKEVQQLLIRKMVEMGIK